MAFYVAKIRSYVFIPLYYVMFDLHATSLIVNLLAFGGTTGHMRVSHAGNTYPGGDIFLKAYERKMAPQGVLLPFAETVSSIAYAVPFLDDTANNLCICK